LPYFCTMDWIFYVALGLVAVIIIVLLNRHSAPTDSEPVQMALLANARAETERARTELAQKEEVIRDLSAQLAARDQQVLHWQQRYQSEQQDHQTMQERLKNEFENMANRLLEQRGQQLNLSNARQLDLILQPLKERIRLFEEQIDRKFNLETQEKSALRGEIEQLRTLNQQLSRDAHNLASALKGSNKVQGDWGEAQLEVLLEKAGLQKGIHFVAQNSFRDEEGNAKRPDFIIQLPDNKQLIIDAKVSLTAFERYFNDPDEQHRSQHLRAHIESLRAHIEGLSRRNYQQLYQINSPDYLLLFIPLESALSTATQADPKLFTDALERNIVLVSTGSLLATLRTVSHMWRQDIQSKSVQEIARQSGLLYDKFVAFVDDLRQIGSRLDQAQVAYGDAMNKLSSATRPGDTLIGKAEKIRELGAKNSKLLPEDLR
jgi:DNA recombination protein RmuC